MSSAFATGCTTASGVTVSKFCRSGIRAVAAAQPCSGMTPNTALLLKNLHVGYFGANFVSFSAIRVCQPGPVARQR